MSTPALVVFGCLTLDNVITADGVCLPQSFGGNCLYAALGARLWCDSVGIVARCGDNYPAAMFGLLERTGIDAGGIRRLAGPHGRNMAFAYSADGSRTRSIPPALVARIPAAERDRFLDTTLLSDAEAKWLEFAPGPDDMPASWWDGVHGIHDAFMPVLRHVQIVRAARERRGDAVWMQIDSPWHDRHAPAVDRAGELFEQIDAVLPSEVDLDLYRPGIRHEMTVEAMLVHGARTIVLKRGAAGCSVFAHERGHVGDVPAIPVDAVDPTGAGDAFCGGFLAGIHLTGDVAMAARYGTVSASFAVEAPGLAGLAAAQPADVASRLAALTST